jgi:hypothetical protein
MEFRLLYQGPLHAESSSHAHPEEKHSIRKQLHKQLSELWSQHPHLRKMRTRPLKELLPATGPPHDREKPWLEWLSSQYCRNGYRFVPLVREENGFSCSLGITFLRRDNPGGLVYSGGDIDNRIKVLFDGLRMPKNAAEIGGFLPENDENPFFCLLEDDSLITEVSVTTDRLLIPIAAGEQARDVFLILHVTVADPLALFHNRFLV